MKICPFCETENEESANECVICGSELPASKTNLGSASSAGGHGSGAFGVAVTNIGPNKIAVIKVIKEFLNCGLAEAKDRCEKGFSYDGLDKTSADSLASKLRSAGASVEYKNSFSGGTVSSGAAMGKYTVILKDVGADKAGVVNVIKNEMMCTETEAKQRCEKLFVADGLSKIEADMIISKLESAGAIAEIATDQPSAPTTQSSAGSNKQSAASSTPEANKKTTIIAVVIGVIIVFGMIAGCLF